MKKSKKFLILFITLSFPVLLYLFLRGFGNNQYGLPVFFEEVNQIEDCSDVNRQELPKKLSLSSVKSDFYLLSFPDPKRDNQPLINEINRLSQEFSRYDFTLVAIYDSVYSKEFQSNTLNSALPVAFGKSTFESLVNCQLVLPTKKWEGKHPAEISIDIHDALVLLDSEYKIRGYYNGFETKEVDRLILELKILLE